MLNEEMRKLVSDLDKTNNQFVQKVQSSGGITLEASKLSREYKDIQRDMIIVDNKVAKKET